jgi:hypothetical protein
MIRAVLLLLTQLLLLLPQQWMRRQEVISLASVLKQRIVFALTLDLKHHPRLSRTAEAYVPILDSKQAD